MNITYETRLDLKDNQKKIIEEYCQEFSFIAKVAWKLKKNNHLPDEQITSQLMKDYFITFNQSNSICSYISVECSKLEEVNKYELKKLKKSIAQREKTKYIDIISG